MNGDLEFHPEALADAQEQFNYLKSVGCGPEILTKFHESLQVAYERIRRHPNTWSKAHGSKTVRKVQILHFRMTAFYEIQANGVPLVPELAGPGLQPRWADRR